MKARGKQHVLFKINSPVGSQCM